MQRRDQRTYGAQLVVTLGDSGIYADKPASDEAPIAGLLKLGRYGLDPRICAVETKLKRLITPVAEAIAVGVALTATRRRVAPVAA